MDIHCCYNRTVIDRNTKKAARKDADIRVRVTRREKAAFNLAARRDGRTLSNWLRWLARRAAGKREQESAWG